MAEPLAIRRIQTDLSEPALRTAAEELARFLSDHQGRRVIVRGSGTPRPQPLPGTVIISTPPQAPRLTRSTAELPPSRIAADPDYDAFEVAAADGCIVIVDYDKAIVNVTRLPYWFLDLLTELGIQAIHVWPTEQKAVNCLAVRPGRVIIAAGCPRTVERLHRAGVETIEIPYDEVHKNGGGIHCSTLPLVRDP